MIIHTIGIPRWLKGHVSKSSTGEASFAAAAREAGFSVMVDKVLEDGRSNIREILLISKTDATHPGKRQKIQKDEVAEGLQSTQLPTRSCDHPA